MDKDDFDFRLENVKNDIEGNYIEIDKKLRSSEKYSKRISQENTVASQQYFGLSLRRTDPRYIQPTPEDYRNVDVAVKGIRDQLEADILDDIQKEFDDKDIINFHVNRYFEDYPTAAERAKEHLFHEGRAVFNEASQKSLSQIYVEQVGQKVRQEREGAALKQSFDTAKEVPSKDQEKEVTKEMTNNNEPAEQVLGQVDLPDSLGQDPADIPELEVHSFDPNEFVTDRVVDDYSHSFDESFFNDHAGGLHMTRGDNSTPDNSPDPGGGASDVPTTDGPDVD